MTGQPSGVTLVRRSEAQGAGRATGIVQAGGPDVLHEIGAPGVGAAIWQRDVHTPFLRWMAGLPAHSLPRLRETMAVRDIAGHVQGACEAAGMPDGTMRDRLVEDVAGLGHLFRAVMGCDSVALRLDVIDSNACTRFHVDNLRARLLCTYRGRGTEFALSRGDDRPEEATTEALTGWVSLLRGTRWPGEGSGVLHRSPPIAGSGQTRLLLVIDPD